MQPRNQIPPGVRRRLRLALGSRTSRRAGIKSHGNPKPKHRLADAIQAWLKAASDSPRHPSL